MTHVFLILMTKLFTFSSPSMFGTFREESRSGRDWLVVNGVPLVEGVLKRFLVPFDEFGKFTHDWNGVPLVLRHPTANGGTAKTPDVDVPLLGQFFAADVDPQNKRLTGEFWFDKAALLSSEEGQQIHEAIINNKMIEVSTGYLAGVEPTAGNFRGRAYEGVHRNIHPDHIAILPDVTGACSINDGCGLNRNSSDDPRGTMFTNCGGCEKRRDSQVVVHLKGESLSRRVDDIRSAFYKAVMAAPMGATPPSVWLAEVFDDHLIVEVNGEKLVNVNYTKSGDTFSFDAPDSWTPVKRKIDYVAIKNWGEAGGKGKGGGAAGKDKTPAMRKLWKRVYMDAIDDGDSVAEATEKANRACKRALKKNDSSGDQDSAVSDKPAAVVGNSKKENKTMNRKLLEGFLKALGYTVVINDEGDETELSLSPTTPNSQSPALPEDLVTLASFLRDNGGASTFLTALKTNAEEAKTFRESLGKDIETFMNDVRGVVKGAQDQAAKEKTALVKSIQNSTASFTEDELNGMGVEHLRKLMLALNGDVDYGPLAGVSNAGDDEEDLLPPSVLTAPVEKGAK